MKSFGFWYKLENQEIEKEIEQNIDLHINLWNIEKVVSKKIEPFIDFGMVIKNFRNIKQLSFLFPFDFIDKDLEDLSEMVRNNEIARMIFNDNNCDTSSSGDYYYIKNTEDQADKLIVRIKKPNGTFEDGNVLKDQKEGNDNYKLFTIDFEKIKKDNKCNTFKHVYLRFRIKTSNLKTMLFCDLKKKNKFLESGFLATQVLDLKINKERNIPKEIFINQRLGSFEFVKFNKIHFLVMNQADDDVSILGEDFIDCRQLEMDGWDVYLNKEFNTKDILVYHWKKIANKDKNEELKEYGKLVKISTATTNKLLIWTYISILIGLGVIGNFLFTILQKLLGYAGHEIKCLLVLLYNMILK